ncbi:ABC transporter permease [Fictibacillus phosphorivorans]|uniref:ABC transporter permease n=1 Tax=Fictibacillus phosphorivorans TaxID=1221500 RepID=UPI00203FBE20|nr:ABC transporter permease [Fictibacillus phosphorivorans]MCM3719918.1 ABC transporter permease [Fictibacillus phosphorivorans]MCM3777628.1 ABC transporter permease [Fictibacillus phosphorivorans]
MRAYYQLTLAQLRIFLRNRQVLFWTLAFPIFLMIMLGSFLGNGNGISLTVAVVDQDNSEQSKLLVKELKKNKAITIEKSSDEKNMLQLLKDGDLQLVVTIPEGYAKSLAAGEGTNPFKLPVYYNETNLTVSQVGLQLVNNAVDTISKKQVDYKPVVVTDSKGVEALNLRYIDFLVPGIVAMMIMSNNMNGVAGQISSWRERGILRRMQGTTLKASTFIAAQITARFMLNGLQAMIVLGVAWAVFGIEVRGSWLTVVAFVTLGTLAFMAIGFIIAGIAKTPESAGPIAGFLSFPMLFLGGVFFPIKDMPEFIQPIVQVLPIAHLSHALRETMNVGASFMDLGMEAIILSCWLIGAFIAASFTFKWE